MYSVLISLSEDLLEFNILNNAVKWGYDVNCSKLHHNRLLANN